MSGKMLEIGSRIVRHSRRGLLGVIAIAGLCMMRPATASGQLIESFENTMDGWTFNPSWNVQQFTQTFSTTTGVTDGSYSLEIDSGAIARTLNGFNYGNALVGPNSVAMTTLLSNSSAVTIDFFAPSGALGYGPQVDLDVNGGPTFGYQSLDGYGYPSFANGVEVTMTFPITPAQQSQLGLDAIGGYGSDLVLQLGSGKPTATSIPVLYIDNIQAIPGPPPVVPEPATLGILGAAAGALMIRRRKA